MLPDPPLIRPSSLPTTTDLADKARQASIPGNIALLPPLYSSPQEAPSWSKCEEGHASNLNKGSVMAYLKVRAMLLAAKQKAIAEHYSEVASQMVAKAAGACESVSLSLLLSLSRHIDLTLTTFSCDRPKEGERKHTLSATHRKIRSQLVLWSKPPSFQPSALWRRHQQRL